MPGNRVDIELAYFKPINTYVPKVGDFMIWHGLFTHFYGIVNAVDESIIKVIYEGMPSLLFTLDKDEIDKKFKLIKIKDIKKSRGGYTMLQGGIWYV